MSSVLPRFFPEALRSLAFALDCLRVSGPVALMTMADSSRPAFGVDFFDAFQHIKEASSAGYPVGFQGWRNRKAYRFLGTADIRHHKVCCHRVKTALHALDGRIV